MYRPENQKGKIKRAVAITRSGFRRYPRHLISSLAKPADQMAPSAQNAALEPMLDEPMAAAWLGHASVLLRVGDVTILVDPVFASRIGMSVGTRTFGVERMAPPPVSIESLPPIDVILITHAHFDHLDKPTLRRLVHPSTTLVTAKYTRNLIPAGFGQVIELNWNDKLEIRGLEIASIKPQHWGARTAYDRFRGYNSYVISSREHRVFVAGDTAATDTFRGLDGVDLAVFGIGAYEPWIHAHANPEQIWQMFEQTGAKHLLPVHHSTFELGEEHPDEPLDRLIDAAGTAAEQIIRCDPGLLWSIGGERAR